MQSAEIVDFAKVRTQRAAAVAAARAASDAVELAVMHAVKKLVDKMVLDKADGKMRTAVEYEAMMREFSISNRRQS